MGPGPKSGPTTPNLGPFLKMGARAPSFPKGYFLETRTRILTTPTFKKKLSPRASKPFPEGAPRKVSMFKNWMAGRSLDMSVSCPETIFLAKISRFKLRFVQRLSHSKNRSALCARNISLLGSNMPWWLRKAASSVFILLKTGTLFPTEALVAVEGCLRWFYLLKNRNVFFKQKPWWLWKAASAAPLL